MAAPQIPLFGGGRSLQIQVGGGFPFAQDPAVPNIPTIPLQDLKDSGIQMGSFGEVLDQRALRVAQLAMPQFQADYQRDRAAFRKRVEAGEIPEFANPVGREFFYKLDATAALQEFHDEILLQIPDLATAKGKSGHLAQMGDINGTIAKTWEKYAALPSVRSTAGSAVVDQVLPQIIGGLHGKFMVDRLQQVDALKRESLVNEGARILRTLSGLANDERSRAVAEQSWNALFREATDSTSGIPSLQLESINRALGGFRDPAKVGGLVALMGPLEFGSGTISSDPLAQQGIREAELRAARDQRTVIEARRADLVERKSSVLDSFDNSMGLNLSAKARTGASREELMNDAVKWVSALPDAQRAEFGDDVIDHAMTTINQAVNFRDADRKSNTEDREATQNQRYATFLGSIDVGVDVSSAARAIGPGGFKPGDYEKILKRNAETQQGRAVLDSTTIADTLARLRRPMDTLLTGDPTTDRIVRAQVGERLNTISDDFYSQALTKSRPRINPETGRVELPPPNEVQDWIDANEAKYRQQGEEAIATFRQHQIEANRAFSDALAYRLPVEPLLDTEMSRTIAPAELDRYRREASERQEPLNDFGAIGGMGLDNIEEIRGKIADYANKTARAGVSPRFAGMIPEITQDKVDRAFSEFKTLYRDGAVNARKESMTAQNEGSLAPKLRNLSDALIEQIGKKYAPATPTSMLPGEAGKEKPKEGAAAPVTPPAPPVPTFTQMLPKAEEATSSTANFVAWLNRQKVGLPKGAQDAIDGYSFAPAQARDVVRNAAWNLRNLSEPSRGAMVARLLTLTGLSPEEVTSGSVTLAPPQRIVETARGQTPNSYISAYERYLLTHSTPVNVPIQGQFNPWMTDFGFSREQLARRDPIIQQVMSSKLVNLPASELERFVGFQLKAAERNGR